MKKHFITYFLAVAAILPAAEQLSQEEVQAHVVAPRKGFVAPHLDWGKNIPDTDKLKAFFIVPGVGYRNSGGDNVASLGYYWSASPSPSSSYHAYNLSFDNGYVSPVSSSNRSRGYSVRCVRE